MRVGFNRDESRQRPAALPPCVRSFGGRRAVLPVDPVSDGTWIAVNDTGLAMMLMNVYPVPFDRKAFAAEARRYASRGAIIPSLLHCVTLDEAAALASRLDPARYPAFRLVLLDRRQWVEILAADGRLTVRGPQLIDKPVMYASSGLGDDRVDPPRRALFEEMLAAVTDPALMQDAFHRHQWPDGPHLSVCMSRPEARTVSLTILELDAHVSRLIYYPESPDRHPEPVTVELAISRIP
ncbi:MAG TPA: NRDE family protein [Phycisphaerae bacterium]|nr:NRDE family protein [Phycisphaerae bacterium]